MCCSCCAASSPTAAAPSVRVHPAAVLRKQLPDRGGVVSSPRPFSSSGAPAAATVTPHPPLCPPRGASATRTRASNGGPACAVVVSLVPRPPRRSVPSHAPSGAHAPASAAALSASSAAMMGPALAIPSCAMAARSPNLGPTPQPTDAASSQPSAAAGVRRSPHLRAAISSRRSAAFSASRCRARASAAAACSASCAFRPCNVGR